MVTIVNSAEKIFSIENITSGGNCLFRRFNSSLSGKTYRPEL
jgi:hypothetical protein